MPNLTVGLPRMHKEPGEKRDFFPDLVAFLTALGARRIVVEYGYGEGIGCTFDDYRAASPVVEEGSYDECLAQDLVIVVRCPDQAAFAKMRPGAILLSMLHYPTRPHRVELLQEHGIRGVSLDGVVDDGGRRLVENLAAVGWNGVRAAFAELRKLRPDFESTHRAPIHVTVMGSGAVGTHARSAWTPSPGTTAAAWWRTCTRWRGMAWRPRSIFWSRPLPNASGRVSRRSARR
ncbi:MAG: hypothetical protein IRZ16_22505 [Myxococcaceae bacterium]|nr:hypothetical protein [Myxococcaceae bacterium]